MIPCAERIGEKRIPGGLQGENKDSEKGGRQLMVMSLGVGNISTKLILSYKGGEQGDKESVVEGRRETAQ